MLRKGRAKQKHVQAHKTHDFPVVELLLLLRLLLNASVRERRQESAHRAALARARVTAAEWESPAETAEMGSWATCCGSGRLEHGAATKRWTSRMRVCRIPGAIVKRVSLRSVTVVRV